MTTKEIAQAVGKDERTVQRWTKIISDKMSSVSDKMSSSSPNNPADYTQEETLAIIRHGMGEAPAGVYQANAEGSTRGISYKELQQIRLSVRDGVLSIEEARRMIGLAPEPVCQQLSRKVAQQVYAVAAKSVAKEQAKLEDKRNNPELFK